MAHTRANETAILPGQIRFRLLPSPLRRSIELLREPNSNNMGLATGIKAGSRQLARGKALDKLPHYRTAPIWLSCCTPMILKIGPPSGRPSYAPAHSGCSHVPDLQAPETSSHPVAGPSPKIIICSLPADP